MTMMRTTLIGFVLLFIGFPVGGGLLGYDTMASFLVGCVLLIAFTFAGTALALARAPRTEDDR